MDSFVVPVICYMLYVVLYVFLAVVSSDATGRAIVSARPNGSDFSRAGLESPQPSSPQSFSYDIMDPCRMTQAI